MEARRGFSEQVRSWFRPWGEIPRHPGPFTWWLLLAVGLGALGLTVPLFFVSGVSWVHLVITGSVGSYCVVLLADSIATSVLPQHTRSLTLLTADWGRRIAVLVALILVILQAILIARVPVQTALPELEEGSLIAKQNILFLLAAATVAYLHCFKLGDLADSVDEYTSQQAKKIEDLQKKAKKASRTQGGAKL